MPTYIIMSNLNEQGLQTLRANPERLREVNRDVEELGARVLHQWFLLGPYDFVNVVEAPDAKTIARISVAIGARGSANMQSYEALDVGDFLELVGGS
ncbi:MAG: GYD domain-containing protein [Actinobacteria bacterium]|nr:GYD domain-containing protein [Actinomycetota bacterium]